MVDLSTALLVTCPAGVQQHEGVGAGADRGQRVERGEEKLCAFQKRSPGEPGEKGLGGQEFRHQRIYIYIYTCTYIYIYIYIYTYL